MQLVETEVPHGAVDVQLELNAANHAQTVVSYQYTTLLTPVNDIITYTHYACNFT